MGFVVLLIVAALVFGAIGLFVKAAAWAFIIAVALVLAGIVVGALRRGSTRIA